MHIHLDCATKHAKLRDKAICSEFRFNKLDQYALCAEKGIDGWLLSKEAQSR